MSEYERVMETFRAADVNRNGTMDQREFTRLMGQLRNGQWSAEWTQKLWQKLDIDRSGEVDSAELVAFLFDVPMPSKAPRKRKNSVKPLAPLVLEIYAGRAAMTKAALMRNTWLQKFGDQIVVELITPPGDMHLSKVCTSNGKVVLWDRATMIGFREDPFEDPEATLKWIDNVAKRDIPRLLGDPCGK